MKKFFAMILSLVMILSLSVPAFAAETDTVTGTENPNNTATQNVTASYTPSTTEDTTAKITGVSITVDGNTYNSSTADNPVVITPTSEVTITVTGTNFSNVTDDHCVFYAGGTAFTLTSPYVTVDTDATPNTASFNPSTSGFISLSEAFEIKISYDGGMNGIGTGLYVIYNDGAEDTTATITGVSIQVGETTYTSGTVTLTPDSGNVTIIVSGTNLKNRTSDNGIAYASGRSVHMGVGQSWDVSDDGTEASMTIEISDFETTTTAHEIKYSNTGIFTGENPGIGTGLYVIYEVGIAEEDKAVITGVSIQVGGETYTSGNTVTLTPTSGDVTIIVTGSNLQNRTVDNAITYASGRLVDMSSGQSWDVSDDGTEASKTFPISNFVRTTTAYEIRYSNDHTTAGNMNTTGIYVIYHSETVSVDITWGAMSFTYDDTVAEGATEETGWTCADGANQITVTNNSTMAVNAAVSYAKADGFDWINGSFQNAEEESVTDANVATSGSYEFYLILSGEPTEAFSDTVGSVTVTITKATTSE